MRINTSVAAALVAGLCVPAFSQTKKPVESIATVNGEAITKAGFDKEWESFLAAAKKRLKPADMTPEWENARKNMLLEQRIEKSLILQEAARRKISVIQKQIDEVVRREKNKLKVDAKGQPVAADVAEETFKKNLERAGVTEKQFETNVKNQLKAAALTAQVVKERVKAPTRDQVRALYDAVMKRMANSSTETAKDPEQADLDALAAYFKSDSAEHVRVQHIFIRSGADATPEQAASASKRAEDIKAQLDKGASFSDMAERYSEDKGTAKNGGDAGPVVRGQFKEIDDVLFGLPVGGVSAVVKTKVGYEIFRIAQKRAVSEIRFEGAARYLDEHLVRAAERAELAKFMGELRKAAKIEIKAPFVKPS